MKTQAIPTKKARTFAGDAGDRAGRNTKQIAKYNLQINLSNLFLNKSRRTGVRPSNRINFRKAV